MNPIFALILLVIGGGLYAVSEESVVHAYNEVNKMFAPAPIPKDPIYMEIKKEDERMLKERNDRVAFCESKLKLVLNDEGMYNLGLKEYCKDPYEVNKITGEPVYYFSVYKDMKSIMKSGAKAPVPLSVPPTPKTGVSYTQGK
jgi:hypothetical protein